MDRNGLICWLHERKHYSVKWLESKSEKVLLAIYFKELRGKEMPKVEEEAIQDSFQDSFSREQARADYWCEL